MPQERVLLSSIRTLTFYSDALTNARRTSPIPQLTCVGNPCSLYTPDAVQCFNVGGDGIDINWKCEADLPEALRFGRVTVSCEGWSRPGDPYVLKGSCGLEYRLVRVPNNLNKNEKLPNFTTRWLARQDTVTLVFHALWIAVMMYMLYNIIKSCFSPRDRAHHSGNSRTQRPNNRPGTGRGWGSSWFGGGSDNHPRHPPPPYSKQPPTGQPDSSWRPGFWTGLGLGAASTYLLNNQRRRASPPPQPARQMWDWERERPGYSFSSSRGGNRDEYVGRPSWQASGEGEGSSSNLGPMRRSTGVGGTTVR